MWRRFDIEDMSKPKLISGLDYRASPLSLADAYRASSAASHYAAPAYHRCGRKREDSTTHSGHTLAH
jgi:hypothetical protein